MKIVVFGATGGTGKQVVERALADGHEVVATARKPEAIAAQHEKLRVVKADVLDAASVEAAVAGADAIISAIGPADNKKPGTLISRGVENMVRAAKKAGVKRFVLESGLMVSDGHALSFIGRSALSIFRRMNRALYEDKVLAEGTVRASDLDWVILRPPMLVHAPAKGGYKHGENARINPTKSLSHADAAEILVRAATEPEFVHTTQEVGY